MTDNQLITLLQPFGGLCDDAPATMTYDDALRCVVPDCLFPRPVALAEETQAVQDHTSVPSSAAQLHHLLLEQPYEPPDLPMPPPDVESMGFQEGFFGLDPG